MMEEQMYPEILLEQSFDYAIEGCELNDIEISLLGLNALIDSVRIVSTELEEHIVHFAKILFEENWKKGAKQSDKFELLPVPKYKIIT